MADVAAPTSSAPADTGASTKKAFEKPERPDQAQYEKELAEADKKLQAAVERQVSIDRVLFSSHSYSLQLLS